MLLPVAIFDLPSATVNASGDPMEGKTLGGSPDIISAAPIEFTVVSQAYSYNALASPPDSGQLNWTLTTDAPWFAVVEDGNGTSYCNMSGTPSVSGMFWANLTVNDTDSYNYVNWTIKVKQLGLWGFVETLSNLTTGTHDPSTVALSSGTLTLFDVDSDEESVVLDGSLYEFSRTNHTNITVASYNPIQMNDGLGWNLSLELYPTREDSSYRSILQPAPKLGMIAYVGNESSTMAGVSLYVADPASGYEGVKVFSGKTSTWEAVANDIIPSYPNRHDDHPEGPLLSESIYGESPDHYVVSFRYASGSSVCEITIIHTNVGLIGKRVVDFPAPIVGSPRLVLATDVGVVPPASSYSFSQWGYWVLDNIVFRGLASRHVVAAPTYEYVTRAHPLWVSVKDGDGNPVEDAEVSISGQAAHYLPVRQRYEAVLDMSVGWNQRVEYSVVADGIELADSLSATIMPDLEGQRVSLPLWWNGWAWVTVLGQDDCTYPTQGLATLVAHGIITHPATSYMQGNTSGASSDLLASQSEMGMHYPHDNYMWPRKLWTEAVQSSISSHSLLEGAYTYASRWDNPSYVGVGDSYITMACPGNSGSMQQLYAQYEQGTRIMGITSNFYNGAPGNHSLIGSWHTLWDLPPIGDFDWIPPRSQWYPYTQYDLMDAGRGPNLDAALRPIEWQVTFWVAEHGGVRRIYHHGVISPSAETMMKWIDNPKTNYSYENWKATDGEVASYVYGRWSTDIIYDPIASNDTVMSYDVHRRDPIAAGYWRVPVTIAFNASGRSLLDINITEGGKTFLKSDGTLGSISGKRIMDVGYDVRGETVYVSYFWNETSKLSFVFSDSVPASNTPPIAAFIADSYRGNTTKMFVFDATSSYDAQDPLSTLMFRWSWDGDEIYETDWSSSPIAHHQFLTTGNHTVRLQVMDRGSLTGEAIAYVEVTDVAIPEFRALLIPVLGTLLVLSVASVVFGRRKKKAS